MIPIDLAGRVALITGVGDNESFAWFISKALQAAGARLVWAVHPRMIRIVPIRRKVRRNARTGQLGMSRGGKKAYVYLKKGETITII